jgi:hypothetical protein
MENNELRHWGVVGMKWGVRRYQNKDGTLTKAGQKRYTKEMEKLKAEQKVLSNKKRTQAKIEKLNSLRKSIDDQKREIGSNGKTSEKAKDVKTNKRTLKDLSDAELRDKVNRLELERRYKDLAKNEEQVNQGKSFAKKYAGEAAKKIILDNAVDVVSQAVKHYMATGANKKIGKDVVFANNKKKS